MKEEENLYYALFCRFSAGIGNARARDILTAPNGLNKLKLDHQETRDKVSRELERIMKNQVKTVTFLDEEYPEDLRNIYDPPILLYYKGDLSFQRFKFAVVGTRRPSQYGVKVTQMIVEELSKQNICIVSGFAYGIDSVAHQTALENVAPTMAILGCGLDIHYPYGNTWMTEPILERGGAIVSEYGMGVRALPAHFPVRNRLISGFSSGVLIVEAGERSGSLITAKIAAEQGKNVYTIPGSVFGNYFTGNHHLIRLGAVLVENADQILEDYKLLADKNILIKKNIQNSLPKKSLKETNSSEMLDVFKKETMIKKSFVAAENLCDLLTEEEFILYQLLEKKLTLDHLVDLSHYPVGKVLSNVSNLIMKGLVMEEGGFYFSIS